MDTLHWILLALAGTLSLALLWAVATMQERGDKIEELERDLVLKDARIEDLKAGLAYQRSARRREVYETRKRGTT